MFYFTKKDVLTVPCPYFHTCLSDIPIVLNIFMKLRMTVMLWRSLYLWDFTCLSRRICKPSKGGAGSGVFDSDVRTEEYWWLMLELGPTLCLVTLWNLGRSCYWLEVEPLSACLQSCDQGRWYHWLEAISVSPQQFARMKEAVVGSRLGHKIQEDI